MVPRENLKFIAVGKACVTVVDEVVDGPVEVSRSIMKGLPCVEGKP